MTLISFGKVYAKSSEFWGFFAKILIFTNLQNVYNLQIDFSTPFLIAPRVSKLRSSRTCTRTRYFIFKHILQCIKAISNKNTTGKQLFQQEPGFLGRLCFVSLNILKGTPGVCYTRGIQQNHSTSKSKCNNTSVIP